MVDNGILKITDPRNFKSTVINSLKEEAISAPNSRGEISVFYTAFGGGHSMAYEIKDGIVNIMDTQVNKKYNYDLFSSRYIKYIDTIAITRTDNLELNLDEVKKYVQ